jgi:hypothetical protein
LNADSNHRAQWWIFDRPLLKDPLFLTAIVVTILGLLGSFQDDVPFPWQLLQILYFAASAISLVGVTLGSIANIDGESRKDGDFAGKPYN